MSSENRLQIAIEGAPRRLETEYAAIFTKDAKRFLYDLVTEFEPKVEKLLEARERRRLDIVEGNWTPNFRRIPGDWKISEIPPRIRNRQLDLGDVSPANTANFIDALYADVRGIQVRRVIAGMGTDYYFKNLRFRLGIKRWILTTASVRHGEIS